MNMRNTAAALAIVGLTTAIGTAAWADQFEDTLDSGVNDTTGMSAIGVDISNAGTTPAQIHQFIASLAPETQKAVLGGCQTVASYPAGIAPNVVLFCDNALGAPARPMAMGYMPEQAPGAHVLAPAY